MPLKSPSDVAAGYRFVMDKLREEEALIRQHPWISPALKPELWRSAAIGFASLPVAAPRQVRPGRNYEEYYVRRRT